MAIVVATAMTVAVLRLTNASSPGSRATRSVFVAGAIISIAGSCMRSSTYIEEGCMPSLGGFQAVVCSPFLDGKYMQVYGLIPESSKAVDIAWTDGVVRSFSAVGGLIDIRVSKRGRIAPKTVYWYYRGIQYSQLAGVPDVWRTPCVTTASAAQRHIRQLRLEDTGLSAAT